LLIPEPYDFERLKLDHPRLKEPYLHEPKKHSHLTGEIVGRIQPAQIETVGLDADTVDQKHAKDLIGEIVKRVKKVYVGGGGGGPDEKVKVSQTDAETDFLQPKLVGGQGIAITKLNEGGDEQLKIAGAGDWIPDVDGRFLGIDERRWDGSKLINLPAAGITSGLEKIIDIVTETAVTSIVVNNLDLAADKAYLILFSLRNGLGTAGKYFIYFNDITTGYNTQQMYSSGSTTASGNLAESRYTYAYANQRVINEGLIMRTPDNITLAMSRSFLWTGSASNIFFHNVHWNNTANPTKIEIRSEAGFTNIGAGSRLMIFKVRG
jgi:hypothetical protein